MLYARAFRKRNRIEIRGLCIQIALQRRSACHSTARGRAMKTCGYCGHENDAAVERCAQCGTAFRRLEPQSEAALDLAIAPPRLLRAGRALVIFFVYAGTQVVAALIVTIVIIAFVAVSQGSRYATGPLLEKIIGPVAILGLVAGGVAMWWSSRLMLQEQLRDNSPTGAAWIFGNWKQIGQGLSVGVLAG